jgi:hypothetical protein
MSFLRNRLLSNFALPRQREDTGIDGPLPDPAHKLEGTIEVHPGTAGRSPRRIGQDQGPQRRRLLRRQSGHLRRLDRHPGPGGHRLHRSLRLRQVHLPAVHEPHERHHPDRPGSWLDRYRRREHQQPRRGPRGAALAGRNGVPEAQPLPKSIFENVAYGPRIHGLVGHKDELDGVVESALRRPGFGNEVVDRLASARAPAFPEVSSKGWCIARAISVSPEVILMDEPCSALDPIATARIED